MLVNDNWTAKPHKSLENRGMPSNPRSEAKIEIEVSSHELKELALRDATQIWVASPQVNHSQDAEAYLESFFEQPVITIKILRYPDGGWALDYPPPLARQVQGATFAIV